MARTTTTKTPRSKAPKAFPEVLNLAEAAAYLRLSQDEVAELVTRQDLPGRRIGNEWRFHKQGLVNWLLRPSAKERLLRHAGAAQDDPYLEQMLESIYRERGRPMCEET